MNYQNIINELIEKNITISTAESCTGGMLGEIITSYSGASSIYKYGFITYANDAKEKMLGVMHETLETKGAVSKETATQMAQGAKKVSGSDISVSVTGIAGPTGGTKEKPVGLVYIALCSDSNVTVKKLMLNGTRDSIRKQTCENVFALIQSELEENH